jgi:hypothetical protein
MKWVHDTEQNPVESELRFEEARTDYASVVRGLVIRSQAGIIDEAFKLELGTAEENMGRLYLERGERIGSIDYVSEAEAWLQNAEETFGMLGSGGRSRADRVRGQQALQRQTLMRLMDRNP